MNRAKIFVLQHFQDIVGKFAMRYAGVIVLRRSSKGGTRIWLCVFVL
jgi:hypothetical protein